MRFLWRYHKRFLPGMVAVVITAGIAGGCCRETGPPPAEGVEASQDAVKESVEPAVEIYQEVDLETKRLLAPGFAHRYQLDISEGYLLHVEIDQLGSDVYTQLLDSQDRLLVQVDSRSEDRGTEHLYFVALEGGTYTLSVRAFDSKSATGSYLLHVDQRLANDSDCKHAEAEKAFGDAFALVQGTLYGVPEQAVVGYQNAADIWHRLGNTRRRADALFELALLHRRAGRQADALSCFQQCLPFLSDSRNRAVVLNEMGSIWKNTGDPAKARDSYDEALELFRDQEDTWNEAGVLYNLGRLDSRQGRPLDALGHLRQAQERWTEQGDRSKLAETLNAVGEVYEKLSETRLALDFHHQALKLQDPRTEGLARAITLSFMAQAFFEAGELTRAEEVLAECLKLREKGGASETDKAKTWGGLGAVEARRGHSRKALELFRRALAVFEGQEDLANHAIMLGNIAWVYLDLGEAGRALDLHQKALDLYRQLTYQEGEALSHLGSAMAWRRLGNTAKSLEHAEKALAVIERVVESGQAPARREELLLPYFSTRQRYFDLFIDLLMEQHRQESASGYGALALATSEQARARHLLEILAENPQAFRDDADPALLEEQRVLREEINAADRVLRRRRRNESLEDLVEEERRQRWRWTEYHRLAQRMREESSWFTSLHQPRPLALQGIQRLLDGQTLLLEYFLGEDRSFLWAVDSSRMEIHELPPRGEIEPLARRTYKELTKSDQINYRVPTERDLDELSSILLRPVADRLAGQRLLIVTSGALEYIPFAALPTPGSSARRLVEDHELVYVPSASVLAMLRGRRNSAGPSPEGLLAIFADAVYSPEDPRLGHRAEPSSFRAGPAHLPRIPYSAREAEAIVAIAEGRGSVLEAFGFEARRDLAISGQVAGYRILHFATHGILRENQTKLSALVLSRYDIGGRPIEGRLLLNDIYELDLAAELVVLSACHSALGQEIRGEGLMGLPRGFLYAGASRVLASLWKARDESTAELMTRFYHHLLVDGQPPPAALRTAQRSMLAEPRYSVVHWAGFVLQGDWY